jgi:hypothetical protein
VLRRSALLAALWLAAPAAAQSLPEGFTTEARLEADVATNISGGLDDARERLRRPRPPAHADAARQLRAVGQPGGDLDAAPVRAWGGARSRLRLAADRPARGG